MSGSFRNLQNLQRVNVSLPTDENGLLGRECPDDACLGYFKIKSGTGLRGSDLPCHCPYCGHTAGHDKFHTPDQIEYANSVALQQMQQALHADLKSFEFNHPARGPFGIGISLKLKDSPRLPLHRYREKQLETSVTCATCTLEFAVYGVFAYCPDCASHNSLQILDRNLHLVRRQLELAGKQSDEDMRVHLTEDALENCVSAFDGFGREACRIMANRSRAPGKASSLTFQNLNVAAQRLQALFGVDFQASVDAALWNRTHIAFMRRHLIAHTAGVIDAKYIVETSDTTAILGRRIKTDSSDVLGLTADLRSLGQRLLELLESAPPGV